MDIPQKNNKTKSTIQLSSFLKDFICFLNRPYIKKYLMTKLYNKGNEQLAQDFFDKISLLEIKKGTSSVIKEENYQSICIALQNIFEISYNPIDALIQKKEKDSFFKENLNLRSKIRSVKSSLPIPIKEEENPQQNQERFTFDEESSFFEEVSFVNNQIDELTLVTLKTCVIIESNPLWVHYVFKRFFIEFGEEKNNSLVTFEEKLMSLQMIFEKEKNYSNFLSLNSKNILSKIKTIPTKISFNTSSPQKVLQRKEFLVEIQHILIKNYQILQKRKFKQIISKLITDILNKICDDRLIDVFINSEIISFLASFVSTRKCSFVVNCFEHASYKTYYPLIQSNNYYLADDLTKKKNEKMKKKTSQSRLFW